MRIVLLSRFTVEFNFLNEKKKLAGKKNFFNDESIKM